MADDNLKAERPNFELNPNIDESKLTDDEKNMLADLRNESTSALPPSLDVPQLETKSEEKVTVLDADLPPPAKVAENISAPFPEQEKMEATPLEDPLPLPDPPFAQKEEAEEGKAEEEESLSSGFENPMDNCPQCGWDLSLQAIAEPEQAEKMGFLHSVLGQKTFIQDYSLFGGKVHVRFRTLTTKEMDVIYNYVFQQRESGEIETIQDYWEKVNRYRLYLQLIYLSASDGSFTHQLPDAYSKESNPHGTDFWQFPAYDPEVGYLDQIEDKILKEVLRTESIQRTISTYCARFNRLVSKLEVMIDNPDFWKETEQQS
jgi:hypothetical protein